MLPVLLVWRARRALVGATAIALVSMVLVVAAWAALGGAAGTTPEGERGASSMNEPLSAGELVRELESRGIPTRPYGAGVRCANGLVSAPGRAYKLGAGGRSGYEYVCLHSYPDPSSAKAAAGRIPPEAYMPAAEWERDTHFFRCGRVIAVYTGYDVRNLRALTGLCGRRFAFGEGFGPDE
jgi:hypothetical protein